VTVARIPSAPGSELELKRFSRSERRSQPPSPTFEAARRSLPKIRLRFRITKHSGHGAPLDAVELLWARWPSRLPDVQATKRGQEIHLLYGQNEPIEARPEHVERERLEVLDLVLEICERHREIRLDWYAVAPPR
jgi:hypothetical protein